jgi:DnaA family protein
LLQAACREVSGTGRAAYYLPLRRLLPFAPDALDGVAGAALVCLDDVDAVAGRGDWESRIVQLVNDGRAVGGRVLMAARPSPAVIAWRLPDLASRCVWGPVFRLLALSDDAKLAVLQGWAARRGLVLPEESGRYLLTRHPRGLGRLLALLERLDRASLAAQRRLTLPFVKQSLASLLEE